MKNHIFRRGTASSIYDQRIIKKSLKQPIFVNAYHDEFVQCVSTKLDKLKNLLIDKSVLRSLPKYAYLINIACGGIVDESALIKAYA